MNATASEIVLGVFADLAFGDPKWLPHPVRIFGRVAAMLEEFKAAEAANALAINTPENIGGDTHDNTIQQSNRE